MGATSDDVDEDPFEGLDDEQRAELEAVTEHDLALLREHWEDQSRYHVHVLLADPDELPSNPLWREDQAE